MTARLLFGDAATGTVLGELPDAEVVAVDELGDVGALAATMPLATAARPWVSGAAAPPQLTRATLEPSRTALWLDRHGVVLWSGLAWRAHVDVEADELTISAAGWHSYFRRRRIRTTLSYAATDQYAIAAALIDAAQAVPGGDVGVDTSTVGTSGQLRDRTYPHWERATVGERLEQLAAVQGGFSWAYRTVWDGDDLVTRLVLRPPTGRATAHVFELGVNVDLLDYEVDASERADTVDAIGSGEAEDLLIRTAADPSLIGTYPLLERVISHTSVGDGTVLAGHAARDLALHRDPTERLSLAVDPDGIPRLGAYEVGDLVRVRGSRGWLDIDSLYRITSMRLDVGDQTDVTVDLIQASAFT